MSASVAMQKFPPEVEIQLRLLTERRDDLRRLGYEAELDLEILEAQPHTAALVQAHGDNGAPVDVPVDDFRQRRRDSMENLYAAALRMQQLIDEIASAPEVAPNTTP